VLLTSQITERLAALCRTCTSANGYSSNIGTAVRVGQLAGAATEAPIVYLMPGREQGSVRYGLHEMSRSWTITGFAHATAHPSLSEHALVDIIVWDIRRCIEARDATLAAMIERITFRSATPGYHEGGGTIVGAAVEYEISYHVAMSDTDTAL
jgi:hypothetical protein